MRIMDIKYSVTFARRGLLYHESLKLARLRSELEDWSKVRQEAIASNLLQTRTISTSKKLCTEIISRLKTLSDEELELLLSVGNEEQCYLLWLAICKRYKLIHEFAVEVLHEKYLHLDLTLATKEFDSFFSTKAEWHDELARLSQETQKKVRQTVFLLMREAHLLNKQQHIMPVLLSNRFLRALCKESKDYLHIFPFSDSDARAIAK